MTKVILLCGKVCSGKSTYANQIKMNHNAVILSCDELMLELFDEQLGDKHRMILQKVKNYLYQLAEKIIVTNTVVILDFGFWTRTERQNTKLYFADKGMNTELHYVKVSQEQWLLNIENRNKSMEKGKGYTIDDTMKQLFSEEFQEPDGDEVDVIYDLQINQTIG